MCERKFRKLMTLNFILTVLYGLKLTYWKKEKKKQKQFI